MSDHRSLTLQYAHDHQADFLNSLKELVSIPSVSTDPERAGDIQCAAQWIAARLTSLGMEQVQIFQTARHPVVYGEWLHAANAPTVLIYGHYDVQPVDPLELWKTGPFEPTIVGDNLYGRGASDMKGQDLVVLSAVESIIKTGKFPINIKWVIEGEEEIGSPNLARFIEDHKDLLKCDFALNTDSGLIGAEHPSVTYGLRGLAYFEVHVQGPAGDLHSGTFGGGVHNPAIVLAELIAGMHDEQGRITWPGFYDQVRPLSEQERAEFARLPITDEALQQVTGVSQVYGEAGFTSAERISARPTLDVNGLLSGFTGAGQKTVLPAKAMAKLSTRLVPDQDPQAIHKGLVAYMEQHAPQTVKWEVKMLGGGPAALVNLENPGVVAMSKALETVWNQKAMYKREGGSIPVVVQMQRLLGIESVICGFGLPDDNLHAPNEKQHLPTWYRGIDTLIHFFFNLV